MQATYLDYNSTNPIREEVVNEIVHYLKVDFGNSGSRTHAYGQRAKSAVSKSRKIIAEAVSCRPEEIIFTSGATEGNNLAILGLAEFGLNSEKKHIISSAIEHKSVLSTLEHLSEIGFEVDFISPSEDGRVPAEEILEKLRDDTLLVSLMGVNNETGAIQPINEVALGLANSDAFFHVDASQSFLKSVNTYTNPRVDLITLSAHKVGGPKGIGAVATRRRGYKRIPLEPIMYGGGQERGLRPGTLPVPLIAGFGKAVEILQKNLEANLEHSKKLQRELIVGLQTINAVFNCDPNFSIPTTVNFSIPGIDSEAAIMALKPVASVSNGSACTSQSYENSHVLTAAHLSEEQISGAIRISWGVDTKSLPIKEIIAALSFVSP